MRLLAFACLAWAGANLPLVWLDRTGLAMLGLGVAALTIGRYAPKPRGNAIARAVAAAVANANGGLSPAQADALARQADSTAGHVMSMGYPAPIEEPEE